MLSLGSALALAGVSAWLITRAWQMPPVLDLSVAVVAVRTFAISRGVLRYCERLATHDTALRAAGTARAQIYHRLASGPAAGAVRLHSGELVARVGADVDALADVLVRAAGTDRCRDGAVTGGRRGRRSHLVTGRGWCWRYACSLAGVVGALAGRPSRATQEAVARQHHSDRDTAGDARAGTCARTPGRGCAAGRHRRIAATATGLGRGAGRRRQTGRVRRGHTDRGDRGQRARRGGGRNGDGAHHRRRRRWPC